MPDLDLNVIEPFCIDDLAGYHEVTVSDTGVVKARKKNGKWQSGMMGLCSWTEEAIAKTHKPGVYTVKLPTPAEQESAKQNAAQGANEARIASMENPWRKSSWNLTQQLMLSDQDPDLAQRFQREARL